MGCFLAGMCVILFPVALRNKLVGGEFVLTTSNFGMNFYIGNNVKATGTYEPLRWGRGDWSFEHEDVVSLAEEQAGRPLKATEVSRYWTRQAVNDIAADPVKWLKLLCKKWLLTWGAIEIGDSESIYAHGDWSVVIGLLSRLLNYGLLIPLAAVGLWAGWPLRKTIWPLYIMLLGYASSITVIFVFDRYRHPMTALVFIFSARGL